MHLLNKVNIVLLISMSCQMQTFAHTVQRRSGRDYIEPPPSLTVPSYYNSLSNPSYTHSQYEQLGQRNSYPYGNLPGFYSSDEQSRTNKSFVSSNSNSSAKDSKNRNYEIASSSNRYYRSPNYSASSDFLNTRRYLNNPYNSEIVKKVSSNRSSLPNYDNRVSKTDAENAKFIGAENQEEFEEGRTLHLKRKKWFRRFGTTLTNPCYPYGREFRKGITPPSKVEGRFLWGLNTYNLYPQSLAGLGCGGYVGYGGFNGGLGSGLLSDPIGPAYYSPSTGIANLLGLLVPGVLQNSFAGPTRPQQFADYGQSSSGTDLQSDPEVDPNYRPVPASVPVRRPNNVFYDSAGALPVTPAQLVGGISTTVNSIIQQLTGNVQPIYG